MDPDAATRPHEVKTFNDQDYEEGDIAILDIALARAIASFRKWTHGGDLVLQFTREGLYILSVDPAHVALRTLLVPIGKYLTVLQNVDVMVDVDEFRPLLFKRRKGLMTIGFKMVTGSNPPGLAGPVTPVPKIVLRVGHHAVMKNVMDSLGMSRPKIPNIPLPYSYEVVRMPLLDALVFVKDIAGHVSLIGTPEKLHLEAEGAIRDYECSPPSEPLIVGDDKAISLFAVDYFTRAMEALTYVKTLKLEMGDDHPIRLTAERFGGLDTIILAPRIEND